MKSCDAGWLTSATISGVTSSFAYNRAGDGKLEDIKYVW